MVNKSWSEQAATWWMVTSNMWLLTSHFAKLADSRRRWLTILLLSLFDVMDKQQTELYGVTGVYSGVLSVLPSLT